MEKKTINSEVGHRIQLSRERAGYTQEQFAELLDVGVQHISRVERGAVGISLTALKKTCEILGVSADYLLLGGSASEEGNVLLRQLRGLGFPASAYRVPDTEDSAPELSGCVRGADILILPMPALAVIAAPIAKNARL